MRALLVSLLVFSQACLAETLMTASDLARLADAEPGQSIAYGDDPQQFGELLLPDGEAPHPVIVWLHGGCWFAPYDISHSRALAQALRDEGFAVWNVEYRRIGNPGGGWPGTFRDVATALDFVATLAGPYPLDPERVLVGGHSAGGQLAMWLAGRSELPASSKIFRPPVVQAKGILALAPAVDLIALHRQQTCNGAATQLLGGGPDTVPERYAEARVSVRALRTIPQQIVIGEEDTVWREFTERYVRHATALGNPALQLVRIAQAGHYELIAPDSPAWGAVRQAARDLLEAIETSDINPLETEDDIDTDARQAAH